MGECLKRDYVRTKFCQNQWGSCFYFVLIWHGMTHVSMFLRQLCMSISTAWRFNGHMTVSPSCMHICLRTQCLILTFQSATVWGACIMWMSLQPWFKEFTQQQIEGCFGFIFTEDIQLFLLSASLLLHLFDRFRLANLWLNCSKRQVNLASQTLPASMVVCRSHIGYEYWKRRLWLVR